jgi:pimeloyl-ACP methyl ester carboxylesterase
MHYVFVHGSWHGAWCWEPLVKQLALLGHESTCIDLPGHGNNKRPYHEITYQVYFDYLKNQLHSLNKPYNLVVHSMSGIIGAPLFDQHPELINHLYLISAFVPQNGKSLIDVALEYDLSLLPSILIDDPITNTHRLDLNGVDEVLYKGCDKATREWAKKQLIPQAKVPLLTPINWRDSGITKGRRTYIICEEDCDVNPVTQRFILKHYPCREISIRSGHFPFLSNTRELANILTS